MTAGDEVRSESVFRERWRERQSASPLFGQLVRQSRWVNAGLIALFALITVGVVAVSTITIAQTAALPAAVQDTSVRAVRGGEPAPAIGTVAQFRDPSGTSITARVTEVTATQVHAHLAETTSTPAGALVVPTGRQRLIGILLSRLL